VSSVEISEKPKLVSLEDRINALGGPLALLRHPRSGVFPFPIRSEFTNWRDEQESWYRTAVLFDQSEHMTDLTIEGPDTYRLLSNLAINSFDGFGPMKAKQLVVCNYDGYVIGDAIAFCLGENHVRVVGRPSAHSWIQFHAETGDYNVSYRRDDRTVQNRKGGRELFRFQVQGPNAQAILEKVNGGPLPQIPFFSIGRLKVGAHDVTVLNHRMSGFPGLEMWGPYEEKEAVRETLLEAGGEYGLMQAGARAYASVATESGWIPGLTPAVYSGEQMRSYREWLPATGFEANLILGGSFVSDRIEDYYTTPFDLGYGFMAKFDHDFIGREALERLTDQPHREKAWLYWQRDDVARIFASLYEQGDRRFKFIEIPAAWYGSMQFDRIESDSRLIGLSTTAIYSSNARSFLSLCIIDSQELVHGSEVSLVWGEPNGGSANFAVERHAQTRIRATIGGKPFAAHTEGSSLKR
jgi:vanillate/3-O-methylgallate O-demethylase